MVITKWSGQGRRRLEIVGATKASYRKQAEASCQEKAVKGTHKQYNSTAVTSQRRSTQGIVRLNRVGVTPAGTTMMSSLRVVLNFSTAPLISASLTPFR